MSIMRVGVVLMVGLALVWSSGCGPSPKDLQIQALQEKVDQLERENGDLMFRLSNAKGERDEFRGRALELQQQLADCRSALSEMPAAAATADQPEGWQGYQGISWIDLGSEILFDSGRAKLKDSGVETIRNVATQIRQNFPDRMIWVIGHTDSDPIKHSAKLWKDNLDLSLNRAAAVHRQLQELGLDAQRMIAGGQGAANPKVPNDTKANKALNRRVQIVAVERG